MSNSLPLSIKPLTRVSTEVSTYVFEPNANIERFLNTIKEKLPQAIVTRRTDDKGYQNVSVTTTNTSTNITPDDNTAGDVGIGLAVGTGTLLIA